MLRAAQHDDSRAYEQLLERYSPLLNAAVYRWRPPGGLGRDDLAQEARIGFLRAVRRWQPDRGPFAPFARRCVHNYLLHALASAWAEKNWVLTGAGRLHAADVDHWRDQHRYIDSSDGCGWQPNGGDRALEDRRCDPEATTLGREQLARVGAAMRALTEWERLALSATLAGIPHRELAVEHGVTAKAVTLAVRRARHKLAERAGDGEPA